MGNDDYRLVVRKQGDVGHTFILYYQTLTEAKIAKEIVSKGYHMPHELWLEYQGHDGEWKKVVRG